MVIRLLRGGNHSNGIVYDEQSRKKGSKQPRRGLTIVAMKQPSPFHEILVEDS